MAEEAGGAAYAASDDDASLAKRLYVIEQLTEVFGFSVSAAEQAIEAVGADDLSVAYNYIIDSLLGQDQGGPVVPIHNCPHILDHVKVTIEQLPSPPTAECTHSDDDGPSGTFKSERTEQGSCPGGENWLCLDCGVVRCSRYVNAHALAHWQATKRHDDNGIGHCVCVSLSDLSVWCHVCQAYLHHEVLDPILQELETLKFATEEPERKKARATPDDDDDDEQRVASSQDGNDDENEDGNENEPCSSDDDGASSPDDSAIRLTLSNDSSDEPLLEIIRAAAAARGIPVELLMHAVLEAGGGSDDDEEPVEYPFAKLPVSMEDVADFIQSENCRSILILAGAGMSVASGIPDFRSSDGLYATLNPDLLTASEEQRRAIRLDPTAALEQTLFLQNPLPCLELNREFILGTRAQRWKATLAHRFVELLHTKTGKLVRLYTQNIDGLEDQCLQLPRDKVLAVHGSMDRAECAMCESESAMDTFATKVRSQIKDLSGKDDLAPENSTAIACEVCGCNTMKPAIVLFRSSLPKVFFERAPDDVKDVDLLFVIGTSLRVAPANGLVYRVPRSALRVLVNREQTGMHLGMNFDDGKRDYFAQGDCDNVLLDLMDHLGWLEDLAPLLSSHVLPDGSAELLRERLAQSSTDDNSNEG